MINELFENIQRHLSMLDLAVASSQKITNYAAAENLESVNAETENRERLINLVGSLQQTIEEHINQLNAALLTSEDIMILKCWFQDLNQCSERMIALDRETVEILSQQKDNTTKEIAHLFKNRELFKGYNHSTKK